MTKLPSGSNHPHLAVLRSGASESATLMVNHLWVFYPITTELNAWYASSFVLDLILLLAMATYGFYTSLGGQPVFKYNFLRE